MAKHFDNKLQEIIEHKRSEVAGLVPKTDILRAAALGRNDFRSLYQALDQGQEFLGLIAEIKKASPSAGIICDDFNPVQIGQAYDHAGASAISVLTDRKYFQGRLDYLTRVRQSVTIPVLRKDFIVHEAQIYEASVAGADAVLLIVAALGRDELAHLLDVAARCQLECLVEVHNFEELDRAIESEAKIIGVNNRNLKTFEVDLETTAQLAEQLPDEVMLVSESGIRSQADARTVFEAGANAILVGETLMRSDDIEAEIHSLMAAAQVDATVGAPAPDEEL
jgi:indole-3-glycerol phosphate synthase